MRAPLWPALLLLAAASAHAGEAANSYESGMRALQQGDAVAAMRSFTAALEADPADGPAAFQRGKLFLRIGEPKLAVADFTTAIIADPAGGEAYAWRGEAKAVLKDDGTRADFDRAVELSPSGEDALLMRAAYFLKLGQRENARADLRLALTRAKGARAETIRRFLEQLD